MIELLVAMVIGLILTAAVGNTFVSNKTSYRLADAQARLQENGRYAIRAMARDIREAGFTGCGTRSGTFVLNNVLKNASDPPFDFASTLSGYESNGTSWTPAMVVKAYNPSGSGAVAPPLGHADVISVRRAFGLSVPIQAHPVANPPGTGNLKIPSNSGLQQSDIVLASDCTSGAVFQITADPSSGEVKHGFSGTPGNNVAALGREFAQGDLTRVSTVTYFLRTGAGGEPSLYRVEGLGNAEEVVDGVANLQVLYGEDTNGDSEVDRYVAANTAGLDWNSVVSVRLSLLLHSVEDNVTDKPQRYSFNGVDDITPTDRRLRRVFTATVNLRNKVI